MEPLSNKMKILLGKYEVVDVSPIHGIVIHFGQGVKVHMHLGGLPHNIKPGDKLELFTEITCSYPNINPTTTLNS